MFFAISSELLGGTTSKQSNNFQRAVREKLGDKKTEINQFDDNSNKEGAGVSLFNE